MPGAVTGVVGRMGSGKSYLAVRKVYKALTSKAPFPCRGCGARGGHVWTNFTIRLDEFPDKPHPEATWDRVRSWDDLLDIGLLYDETGAIVKVPQYSVLPEGMEGPIARIGHEGLVVIDEAQLWAPSNKAVSFPVAARFKLAQARKYGLDIWWITQHETRVNRVLRDLTNYVWTCSAWMGGLFFSASMFEPEYLRQGDKRMARKFYKMGSIMRIYDTLEIMDVDETVWGNEGEQAKALKQKIKIRRRNGSTIREDVPILIE